MKKIIAAIIFIVLFTSSLLSETVTMQVYPQYSGVTRRFASIDDEYNLSNGEVVIGETGFWPILDENRSFICFDASDLWSIPYSPNSIINSVKLSCYVENEGGSNHLLDMTFLGYLSPDGYSTTTLYNNIENSTNILNNSTALRSSGFKTITLDDNVDNFILGASAAGADYFVVGFLEQDGNDAAAELGYIGDFTEIEVNYTPRIPHLILSPTSHDFGTIQVNQTSNYFEFDLENTGNFPAEYDISITGSNSSQFELHPDSQNLHGLDPGASCGVKVRFAPTSSGNKNATLSIIGNDQYGLTNDVYASLSGTGYSPSPNLVISPTNHNYGDQPVGTTSSYYTFNLENTGNATANGNISLTGSNTNQFEIHPDDYGSFSLGAGNTKNIRVRFSPTSTGNKSATLFVDGTSGTNDVSASLCGTGTIAPTPNLVLTPTSHDFGDQQINTSSNYYTFSLENTGNATAQGDIYLTGSNTNQFEIHPDDDGSFSLGAGNTKDVRVRFSPTSTGSKSATLYVDGTGSTNSVSASLSGNGTSSPSPNLELTPSSHNFGDQQVGTTSNYYWFDLENTGNATAQGDIYLTGSNSNQFEIHPDDDGSFSLGAGNTKNIRVRFSPTSIGIKNATLFVDGTGGTNDVSASLSGNGTDVQMTVDPTSINVTVPAGGLTTRTITITNNGTASLDWSAYILNQTFMRNESPQNHLMPTTLIGTAPNNYPVGPNPVSEEGVPQNLQPAYGVNRPNLTLPKGSIGWGIEAVDGSGCWINTDAPSVLNNVFTPSFATYAGEFGPDNDTHMYFCDNNSLNLIYVDMATGSPTTIGPTGLPDFMNDMACDRTTGTMYALYDNSIYTVNLSTGACTLVGAIGNTDGLMIAIAVDGNGNMWGHDLGLDEIWSIDKTTGAGTSVGSTGFDANYAQSMGWDPLTDIVYLSAFNNSNYYYELRTVDLTTGNTALLGGVYYKEIVAFSFPGDVTTPWITIEPTSGTIAPNGGTQNITVNFDAGDDPIGTSHTCDIIVESPQVNDPIDVPVTMTISGDYKILVVDHDLSLNGNYTNCWPYYETALIANGFDYTYYQVETDLVTPDLATMQMYDCIIWFSGECWGYYGDDCMTPESESKVANYLNNGGSLFFSAQDYLWASYSSAGTLNPGQFPYDYLGLASVSQDMWYIEDPDIISVDGVTGSCAEGYNFTASDIFTSTREGLYIDEISGFTANAQGLFEVTSPSPVGMCASQKDTGTYKSIFTTLAWAAIDNSTIAINLLGDMINWLIGNYSTEDPPSSSISISNSPNPFSHSTIFNFSLKNSSRVTIDIYNLKGQLVKNLTNEQMLTGIHNVTWNGTDNSYNEVPSGIYFTRIITDGVENIHKVIVIR
ncbi:MAG TPA: choice-of-anchor D domain-containing protein [Candidatus Cloacimonetes bacterium]|nr:choice-of-anchor D domain-containing protein [Candidatus Cloacimonadota bacterium]HEX37965.1 choice-of-anchor D domain-containing protein [Candidatus Cloacimonadota bacterium]